MISEEVKQNLMENEDGDNIPMEAHITITGGTHKGKNGTLVSHTPHFTKVNLGDKVVRCKKAFVQVVPQVVQDPQSLETYVWGRLGRIQADQYDNQLLSLV